MRFFKAVGELHPPRWRLIQWLGFGDYRSSTRHPRQGLSRRTSGVLGDRSAGKAFGKPRLQYSQLHPAVTFAHGSTRSAKIRTHSNDRLARFHLYLDFGHEFSHESRSWPRISSADRAFFYAPALERMAFTVEAFSTMVGSRLGYSTRSRGRSLCSHLSPESLVPSPFSPSLQPPGSYGVLSGSVTLSARRWLGSTSGGCVRSRPSEARGREAEELRAQEQPTKARRRSAVSAACARVPEDSQASSTPLRRGLVSRVVVWAFAARGVACFGDERKE